MAATLDLRENEKPYDASIHHSSSRLNGPVLCARVLGQLLYDCSLTLLICVST